MYKSKQKYNLRCESDSVQSKTTAKILDTNYQLPKPNDKYFTSPTTSAAGHRRTEFQVAMEQPAYKSQSYIGFGRVWVW